MELRVPMSDAKTYWGAFGIDSERTAEIKSECSKALITNSDLVSAIKQIASKCNTVEELVSATMWTTRTVDLCG